MTRDSQQFENITDVENEMNSEVKLTEVPVRVQRIHIDGIQRTKNDIITQHVKDVFTASNFDEMVRFSFAAKMQMEMLGLFKASSVFIDIHRGESAAPDGYEITYIVDEPRRVTGGVSTLFGTNEGSLLLSVRMPNAAGRGERISSDFIYGSKNAVGWSLNFIKPLLGSVHLPVSAGVFQNSVEFPWSGYKELNRGLACDFSFPAFFGVNTVRWEGAWRELTSLSRTTAYSVREQSGPSLKSAVRYTWSRDTRDSRVLPSSGYLLKAVHEVAGLMGDANYWKHEAELQAYRKLFWDTVVQMSVAGGLMKPMSGTKLSIMDHFFLGGPLTLRGFNIKGVGPHEDGCALGANAYWSTAVHVYTPLPFRPGRGFGDLFRTHFFVNAGNLSSVNLTGSRWTEGLLSMSDTVRWSYGAGLVLRLGGIARLELNYVVPVKVQPTDSVCNGLQFGIGVSFL